MLLAGIGRYMKHTLKCLSSLVTNQTQSFVIPWEVNLNINPPLGGS